MEPKAFTPSKFTIRLKLLVITSAILLSAIGSIIVIASHFFRKDNEVRVKENTMQLTEVIAKNLNSEIRSLRLSISVIIQSIRITKDKDRLSKGLIEEEPSILFLQSVTKSGEETFSLVNNVSQGVSITEDNYRKAILSKKKEFQLSFDGSIQLVNLSSGQSRPLLGLSFPYPYSSQSEIVIVVLNAERFFESFHSYGFTESFLVNGSGRILFHTDSTFVLADLDLSSSPIVDRLMKSPIDNGQYRYKGDNGDWFLGSFKKLDGLTAGIIATVPEDKAFEEVYNIQRRNFYLLIAALNLAIVVIFFFSKKISDPILKLVLASQKIEAGDYKLDLKPDTRDEIGILTNSFASMSKGLDEREKLKVSFGKFVNEEIAELSMHGELKVGGEKKNCAILFSDIRSFTSISEKLRPEEVVEFLNDYMSRMVKCVKNNNGYVDKFIGDAIMATWGALKSSRDSIHDSVAAALDMRMALMEFNRERGGARKPKLRIGIGLNYGSVISGQIGSDEKMEYTVIGDAVNLASRVESVTKNYGIDILVSDAVYDETKKEFVYQELDSIPVKGKSKPVKLYALLGKKGTNVPVNIEELRIRIGYEKA